MSAPLRRRGALPLLAAACLVTGACSNGAAIIDYPTPPASAPTTSTTMFDYESVTIAGVPGRTTTTIDNEPGKAHLTGTVVGPDGPVPMANVKVERLVQDAVLAKDVVTGPDGAWKLDLIRGGRYRVRAWRTPDLSQVTPEIFYLGAEERRALTLTTARYSGLQANALIAPSPPIVNEPANISVVVSAATVDGEGIVRGTPQGGTSVQLLTGFGDWRLETPAVQTTDVGGSAQWRLVCLVGGQRPLSVIIGSGTPVSLTVPPCDDGSGAVQPAPASTFRTTTTTRAPTRP